MSSNTDSYLIGDDKEMCDLIGFKKLNTSGNVSRLSFNGKNVCVSPVSIQFNYDSAGDMVLPVVNFNNIALVRIKIGNPSEDVKCRIGGFKTDVQTGIVYNNKLRINGKTFNGFVSDVNSGDICLVVNDVLNNIQYKPNGQKVTLGRNIEKEINEFYKKPELAKMGVQKDGKLYYKHGIKYKRWIIMLGKSIRK